jgi:hypothetical protein
MKTLLYLAITLTLVCSCRNKDNSNQVIGRWAYSENHSLDTIELFVNGKFKDKSTIIISKENYLPSSFFEGNWKLERDSILVYINHMDSNGKPNLHVVAHKFVIEDSTLLLISKLPHYLGDKIDTLKWRRL